MMNSKIPFTLTGESLTLVVDGQTTSVQKGNVQFNVLRDLLIKEDWVGARAALTPTDALATWLKKPLLTGYVPTDFSYRVNADGLVIRIGNDPTQATQSVDVLPDVLQKKIRDAADRDEDPRPFILFYDRLQQNPSKRSVDQLWGFMQHAGLPIEPDGTFLAYKGVTEDLLDVHSRTFDNSPGRTHSMPRNQISDDPREACHAGFHVGAPGYAGPFGSRTVIVRVDPANVVSVPYDHNEKKMRVSAYTVVGHHVADGEETEEQKLPDTTFEDDTVEDDDDLHDGCGHAHDVTSDTDDEDDDVHFGIPRPAPLAPASPTGVPKTRFAEIHKLVAKDLFKVGIGELRTYASQFLKIVGASKLPGGKTKLISRIVRVRRTK